MLVKLQDSARTLRLYRKFWRYALLHRMLLALLQKLRRHRLLVPRLLGPALRLAVPLLRLPMAIRHHVVLQLQLVVRSKRKQMIVLDTAAVRTQRTELVSKRVVQQQTKTCVPHMVATLQAARAVNQLVTAFTQLSLERYLRGAARTA